MERVKKTVDIASNIAVIAVAILLAYFFINRYFGAEDLSPATQTGTIQVGTRLEIKEVDFSQSNRSLLLVLSTSCHFCTESLPFYRRIASLNAINENLRMIGAFIQDSDTSNKYLAEQELNLDQVVNVDADLKKVRGTPTLILVDRNGIVLEQWYGKLKAEKEAEVLDRAFSDTVPISTAGL